MGRTKVLFTYLHRHREHLQPGRRGHLLPEPSHGPKRPLARGPVATHGKRAERLHTAVTSPRHGSQQQLAVVPRREETARDNRHRRRADRRQRQGRHQRLQAVSQVARQNRSHHYRLVHGRGRHDELFEQLGSRFAASRCRRRLSE